MSFILDALKKSEAERQRRVGPTLLEVRVALPRRRFPIWALALGALLLVNAALLAWFVWLRPATLPGNAAVHAALRPAAPASASAAAGAHSPAPPAAAAERRLAAAAAPPASSSAAPAQHPTGNSGHVVAPQRDANPADFEPAVAPSAASASDAQQRYAGLPTLAELGGSVPPMHLDLLVHSASAAQSYALIDMQQAHVGDRLPNGAKVLAITHKGVVLDYRGQQFMLTPR